MEKMKKEGKAPKWIFYLVIPLAVFSLSILTLFIIIKNPESQESAGEMDVPSEAVSEQEGFGSIKPSAGKPEERPEEKTGLGGGGGGTTFSETPGVQEASGSLEIGNIISRDYTSSNLGIVHYSEAQENIDKYDSKYYAMFDSSGIASKIVSKVGEDELDNDARPTESRTDYLMELSLVSQSGNLITISSPNELRVSMPLEEYSFGSQKLTLQQYDPESSETIADYDVREIIEQGGGTGVISLPDLKGTYQSGEPYAYFRLKFS
jgi:hypothetical protein